MNYQIAFNSSVFLGPIEIDKKTSGDGKYTRLVSQNLESLLNCRKVLLTTSCTSALEMAAILLDIKENDEIIAPSYTFVSTVNAFVLRGAKIVFVDVEPETMNIDPTLIKAAITNKTKAIVVVHYAGISCDMDKIMQVAKESNLFVVEDAAQAVMSKYKGRFLGTIGDFGTFSFHDSKNYSMGEGGALLLNNSRFIERAEIIREKGTNRTNFIRGQVDKYTWVDVGSSYLPSDILAAYLYPQLEMAEQILKDRLSTWNLYYQELSLLSSYIELVTIPQYAYHNAHMFFIKLKDLEERTLLISHLANVGIQALFHYIPLHSSPAGKKYGRFHGDEKYTTIESERLLRLPIYYQMDREDVLFVCNSITRFFVTEETLIIR
jgi:dTDP-4-amino-4,6-dideoxygalactose transaminase